MSKGEKKATYFTKLRELFDEFKSVFVVNVDNVTSNQMHQIRASLRKEAVILMGKNTMVRRAMKNFLAEIPELEKLLPYVRGNIGFVFTNSDLKTVRDKVLANKVAAPAKAGILAPCDVFIPAGNTGMEPGKTSFFQALGVPTKITKGSIEIINDFHCVKKDTKVGPSEATLLNMMKISPFTYGMTVIQVYDEGNCFPATVLDIDNDTLLKQFFSGLSSVAAVSLVLNYPTLASVPHSLINVYKKVLAVSVETEYTFPSSEKIKAFLADPSAFAAAAPTASSDAPAAAAAAAPVEEEEDSDDGGDFDLFD
ncbi:ribosomal protein P0 (A0) (L10E) [Entomophthora muscae]|uniref:Ribosomal protein P0 (A0) (L10E) n=1 Tax=Entomophthora muscae TaxID=34485 RepID=A0ACC2SVG4_9FUNG|nr:ribosomal protein P0 (A0) (L10E) [Entomophthora muscae]